MGNWLGEKFLFCGFLLITSMAGELFALEKNPEYYVNIDKEQCLFEILRSPITKLRYPDLLSENFNERGYNMLKEMDSFCDCSVKERQSELMQKKTDKMSWRFRDKKEGLEKEDQCALAKFSNETMQLFYEVVVSNRFRRDLEETLNTRLTQGMRIIASDLSVRGQTLCVETKILERCTRIKSLRSTYQCIQKTTIDPKVMDSISLECPSLMEKTNYRIAGDDLSI